MLYFLLNSSGSSEAAASQFTMPSQLLTLNVAARFTMTRRHTAHFTGQEVLLPSAGAEEPRWPSAMHALSHCAHIGLCARAHWVVRARALGYARAMGDCNAQAPRGGCCCCCGGGGARLWARCREPGRSSSAQPRPATRGAPQVGEGGFQRPETCGRIRWRLCPCYL